MKWFVYFLILGFSSTLYAKEWKSLKIYQKTTHKETLSSSGWLKSDRVQNTLIWQKANTYNLKNKLSQEYEGIVQRRDFYEWLYKEIEKKGHEVIWIKMAHFISKKMHLMEAFPYSIFSKKKTKTYAKLGSKTVFNNAFNELQKLYQSKDVLKSKEALAWDKAILKEEQYVWIDSVYKNMDAKSLKTLERIVKWKFLYGFAIPKSIRFKGQLANPKSRYNYALMVLKPYCQNRYKS